jgi:ribulose-phosphate 3-epimerase
MIEIIPAIIGQNFREVEEKIRKVEPYVPWVQLDIMDGRFVATRTWNNPSELASLKTALRFEADLMVEDPLRNAISWIRSRVERVFVQIETLQSSKEVFAMIEHIREGGKEVGLTLNVETPPESVYPYVRSVDWVLFRGGIPGSYGQPFQDAVIEKIRVLRRYSPAIHIMIDGGVRLDLVSSFKEAGVNALAVGSAIFRAPDIKRAIEVFHKEAE